MKERIVWIDYARAIGIILVVYGHVARGVYNAGIPFKNESLYQLVDGVVYSFHMPLFFFLSGIFFLDSLKRKKAWGLILNKIDTIAYPYIIWSIIHLSVTALLSSFTNGDTAFSDILTILWQPQAHFWFLYVLFFLFVIAAIAYSQAPARLIAPIYIISLALYLFHDKLPSSYHFHYIKHNFVYFTFSILFSQWGNIKLFESKMALAAAALLFLISQYIFQVRLNLGIWDRGIYLLLTAKIGILLVVIAAKQAPKLPWLAAIGVSSMAIYLMHVLFGSGARIILQHFLSIESAFVHLLAGCVVGVCASLATLYLIKKFELTLLLRMPISRIAGNAAQKIAAEKAT